MFYVDFKGYDASILRGEEHVENAKRDMYIHTYTGIYIYICACMGGSDLGRSLKLGRTARRCGAFKRAHFSNCIPTTFIPTYISTLKMETARFSKTQVNIYHTTRRHIS
jgi:hypothetical protein